jgi:hypothetical protein
MAKYIGPGRHCKLTATAHLPRDHIGISHAGQHPRSHRNRFSTHKLPRAYIFCDNTGNGATMSNIVRANV